jgi:hypothetical protein
MRARTRNSRLLQSVLCALGRIVCGGWPSALGLIDSNMSRTERLVFFLIAAAMAACIFLERISAQRLGRELSLSKTELARERAAADELREQVGRLEQEREKLRKEAAEVYRLRGEISTLRDANNSLEQKAARAVSVVQSAPPPAVEPQRFTPPTFSNYSEMGKFVAGLRAKAQAGSLSPAEQQYLQSLKPAMEKLEGSPADFAALQTELIQAATGISDADKTERIRQLIQRVYENAVSRGLDMAAHSAADVGWVEERFQLDRRGTKAVEGFLSDEERAAFNQNFKGIMGVDLGTDEKKGGQPRNTPANSK